MPSNRILRVLTGAVLAIAGTVAVASAQITTGNVSGTVIDSTGGVIPGATVTLTNEAQATKVGPVTTNGEGIYVFANVNAGTYTLEIGLSGFKTLSRTGIVVGGGARVAVGATTLEAGGMTDRVDVKADAPLVKAASGERSSNLERQQLEALPVASHNFMDFLRVQPGINTDVNTGTQMRRVGGGGQDNIMLNGLSALDSGNNGVMSGMNLPAEAISEVQVLTSGYSAEYGRSSGVQVSAVTRSGTNRFRGSIYDYERNSDWNSNTWQNLANGVAKNVNKQRDWGYTVGGPVGKPGGNNKVFFFYSHEYRPRQQGGATNDFRVPTLLERRGDFSETRDNNNAVYNLIYDQSTGLPKSACSTTDQSACFRDGGVLGRIPVSKLYGPGMAILNQYPLPNVEPTGTQSYNHRLVTPVQDTLSYTPVFKVDYQFNNALRFTVNSSMASARIVPNLGAMPGLTDQLQQFPLSFNTSFAVNYTVSPTMFLEGTYGVNQNRLGTPSISPLSNRNNVVCPADIAAMVANCTAGAFPFLFADAGVVDPNYYEYGALEQVGSPFFENGRILLPPQLNWGTTRIQNNNPDYRMPSINFPGFMNINRIQQASISLTKVAGTHTLKAGFYLEHSYKAQNTGSTAFQGQLNFGVDTNNPLETTFPYANAAAGIFSTYTQQSRFIEGNFYYNNIEWYLQDNWKVSPKLTLDYGLRFANDGPYTDELQQVANFFPDKWSISNAPFMYVPGCPNNVNPCAAALRVAKDPRTGALLPPGSASFIGSVIPGSGAFDNGMIQAGTNGISKAGYTWPTLVVGPRFGAAYDLTGQQKYVVRGSMGLYFDRPDGNTAFGTVANPPTATGITQQWGRLAELGNAQQLGPVPQIVVNEYDMAIPKDFQWNIGTNIALPWRSSVDVSYVGHHAFDVLGGTQNGASVNLNAIDVGTTLTAAGTDPTLATPTALNNNLLRPFRGYSNINVQMAQFTRTFHSIQSSFNRRFSNGFSFGFNHTWTLFDEGTTNLPGPQVRLVHAADGSYSVSPDQAVAEKLFADQGTTTHIATGNFVYDMPDIRSDNGALKAIGYLVNDWQLSGIATIDSGAKYDIGYSYNTGPTGQALTGSPDYNSRIVINDLSAFGSGCSSDQYNQLGQVMTASTSGASNMTTNAATGPQIGSKGLESGRNLLTGCKDHRMDLAIQRTIRVGGSRQFVIRADMYNAFNTVIYNGRSTGIQYNSTTDMSVRNSQYNPDGTMNTTRVLPNQAGFGAANSAYNLRTVQLQFKFLF